MDYDYKSACELLSSQGKFHISLELTRISNVLKLFCNPQDSLKFIHVAGTNGKGSTCKILASILKEAGYKVGLYTSPHLTEYVERINISGVDIPKDEFAKLVFDICKVADENEIHLTEFEILTTMAFLYFHKNNVDLVILETGLGGRFDATNVIKENICSVITSISLDHTERLGDTVEKIAFEKAGIIKKSPVIVSPQNAGYKVIKNIATNVIKAENNVEISFDKEKNQNYASTNNKMFEFNLLGLWQKDNLILALETIEYLRSVEYKISESDIENGLKKVKWACRMEYFKEKNLILDGAHNVDAAKRLKEGLDFYFPKRKRVFIYGTLRNKDYETISKTLFEPSNEVYFYEFQSPNALTFNEFKKVHSNSKKVDNYLIKKLLQSNENNVIFIVCGSLYMLGELLAKKISFET